MSKKDKRIDFLLDKLHKSEKKRMKAKKKALKNINWLENENKRLNDKLAVISEVADRESFIYKISEGEYRRNDSLNNNVDDVYLDSIF